ncbi:MAG: hypothetical protein JW958_13065 [Candidatus Eisenbacteria bacterium]|nr:hypothetical protein [Candidatus Eisenbacteria bacterium]
MATSSARRDSAGSTRLFLIGTIAAAAALFAVLRPLFAARIAPGPNATLLFGLAVCLAGVIGSYFMMRRALAGTAKNFLAGFVGGIAARFLLFAAAIAFAFAHPALDGRGTAVAILAAFLPLTAIEVYSVVRDGSVRVKRTRDPGRGEENG